MCSGEEDLELVECAVRRVLKEEIDAQKEENADASIQLLSKLLNEVHAARTNKEQTFTNQHENTHVKGTEPEVRTTEPGVKAEGKEAEAKDNATEAAVKAATAAANAAQAAAESVAKNSQIVEVLLETVRSKARTSGHSEESDEEELAGAEKNKHKLHKVGAIMKNLQRQNVITHWILGFMVVTTAIWRFKEITWIIKLRKMFSNPWDAVGGMFTGGGERHHKYEEDVETKSMLPELPHIDLPTLFHKSTSETEETSS